MSFPFLTFVVLVPLITGLLLLFSRPTAASGRGVALAAMGFTGFGVLVALARIGSNGEFHFVERYNWLSAIGFEYHLAADGISAVFLFLTFAVFFMSILASARLPNADGSYYALMLILQGGLLGTFTAQNFLHFFFFWELSLIPAFFLLKLYGGSQRAFAATQFFIYTMVGSIGMLLAFLSLYLATGTLSFSELSAVAGQNGFGDLLAGKLAWTHLGGTKLELLIFLLAFAGVAVKVPLWPLHSWQPLAYAEAPTPVTMALTGIMSKMGVYALIRLILPIFPHAMTALRGPLLALAVVTILYGAFAAFAQRDIKKLFAYSSLSHLGYCFLGIIAAGQVTAAVGAANDRAAAVNGVLLQVLSHGLVAAALFAFIGFLEHRNAGARAIERYGGLRSVNPQFAGLMGVALFASLGLPGLSGFPAEFLIFKGSFPLAPLATAVAVLGLLLTAIYILHFFGRVFYGPLAEGQSGSPDLTGAEKTIVVPAILAAFLLGVIPQVAIQFFNGAVFGLVQQLGI